MLEWGEAFRYVLLIILYYLAERNESGLLVIRNALFEDFWTSPDIAHKLVTAFHDHGHM
jgi:hypothetical protein